MHVVPFILFERFFSTCGLLKTPFRIVYVISSSWIIISLDIVHNFSTEIHEEKGLKSISESFFRDFSSYLSMLPNQLLFWVYSFGLTALPVFFYFCYIYNEFLNFFFSEEHSFTKFDFIIVGAGTAGIIVASRLSENPSFTVLLLEAGDDSNFLLDVPVVTPLLQFSRYDWKYSTKPQKHACLGLKDRSSRWPRGKIVGGSSRLNYALYVRGQKKDYDNWSNQGNKGWKYAEILPYFKKSENQRGRFKDDDVYHSNKGEWSVDDPPWVSPMADTILSSAVELGMGAVDLNANWSSGFMLVQANLENGKRSSSETAFLRKAAKRKNLKVISNAHVEKVLFKNKYEVYGVIYSKKGTKYKVEANKEIVLSAGTIESPKILMLSGIGPKDHLRKFEIPVLQDLPVGKNLQDHITTGLDLIILNETMRSLWSFASPWAALQYFFKSSGPWVALACETIGFLHSSLERSSSDNPDLQLMSFPFGLTFDGGIHLRKVIGISDKVWSEYFSPLVGHQTASITPVLLRPKSKGELLLHSTDPLDSPEIDPGYLSHDDDVNVLIKGLQMVEKIVKTEPMKKLGSQLNEKIFPGCESFHFGSDSYWECYIRHLTMTSYHPVGTCKMGPENDHSAVVDPELRVHGVSNLRVIDASIMPIIVSGNTNAATMMIGEKGADMIKQYWSDMGGVCQADDKDSCPR